MRGDTTSKGSSSITSESRGAPSRSLLNIFRIHDLPDFLLVEILCRLPCKFVLRCKCVCKSWSTIISHRYFDSRRALYLRNIDDDDNEQILMFVKYSYAAAHPTPEFFTTSKETPTHLDVFRPMPRSLNIHLADQNKQVVVIATHNDLILLCDAPWNYQRSYYICNPYTKQWVALPQPPRCQTGGVHLGLTTCDSYSGCRVVRIVEIFEAEPAALYLKVEIFSSETGEWIETVVACPQGFRKVNFHRTNIKALAYKGTLYWLSLDGSLLGLELDYSNYHKHRCRFISKPSPDHVDLNQAYETDCLSVCRGYLRLCRLYPGPSCTLYVWELKEEDEAGGCKMMKWCLKERFVLDKLASELEKCWPQAFDPNDEDILYLWRIARYPAESHAPIVMCNIRTMTVADISQKLPCRFRIDAFPFVLPRWR